MHLVLNFFFSSRRRHTRLQGDWSSDVCSSDLEELSSAALEALDAIVAATAEATSHAQRIAAAAGDQDKAFGKLRQRIHAVAEIAGKNRAEADDVATRADEAARGVTDLERATRELEDVAAMLRDLTRGFASIA